MIPTAPDRSQWDRLAEVSDGVWLVAVLVVSGLFVAGLAVLAKTRYWEVAAWILLVAGGVLFGKELDHRVESPMNRRVLWVAAFLFCSALLVLGLHSGNGSDLDRNPTPPSSIG